MPDGGREIFLRQGLEGSYVYTRRAREIIAAMPDDVSATRSRALDRLIGTLEALGLLEKMDFFYDFFGAESLANAAINLASPGDYTLTKYGTVTQGQGYGAKFDGSTGYFDTGFILGTNGDKYQTSDCHIGTWETTAVSNTNDALVNIIGTGRTVLNARTGSGAFFAALNVTSTTGLAAGAPSTSVGHTLVTRSGNDVNVYKDGSTTTALNYTAATATAVVARSLLIGARNNAGTVDQFSSRNAAFVHGGQALTAAENANLYSALLGYYNDMQATYIYASAVSYGGIGVGSDTTGIGSREAPFQTIAKAATAVAAGQTIALNGDPASPTTYTHSSFLTVGNWNLKSVEAGGAIIKATTTSAQTVLVNPGDGGSSTISGVKIDGQSLNPQGIELSNTPTVLYSVTLRDVEIVNVTQYAVWTSNIAAYANLTVKDCTFTMGVGRGLIQHLMATGASLTVDGGSYTITNYNAGSSGAFIDARTVVAGTSLTVRGSPVVSVVMDAAYAGASVTGILSQNIASNRITDALTISIDTSVTAKAAAAITLQTSNDGSAQDMGGFLIEDVAVTVKAHPTGSAKGITIGRDGTYDGQAENGLLGGGTIRNCSVTGVDANTQTSGFHAYLIASWADTALIDCTAEKCYLGFGIKESNATVTGGQVRDFTGYGVIYKASRTGCVVDGVTTISIAGNNGTRHVDAHSNGDGLPTPGPSDTGNNCAGTTHRNCVHRNEGATGVLFVDCDPAQDVTFTGNRYTNVSGTLAASPWVKAGVSYSTLAAWQAVEPTATG